MNKETESYLRFPHELDQYDSGLYKRMFRAMRKNYGVVLASLVRAHGNLEDPDKVNNTIRAIIEFLLEESDVTD